MQYYHEIVTEKSFKFLQGLKKRYRFILIGGWAVFLYSRSLDRYARYKRVGRK